MTLPESPERLEIIYRDEHLIAVNKPAGLLVHRSEIDRHETRFAIQILRDQIGQHVHPVHRLDKPTSGVLLFALHAEAARGMMDLFTAHTQNSDTKTIQKTYLAVVRGYTSEQAVIDYPLKHEFDKMVDRKAKLDKAAQEAITHYQRLATVELPYPVGRYATTRYSLLQLTPQTGRKHQLRRHMKHIFHPIVGDTQHGDGKHNDFFRHQLDCRRLLLTASQLAFTHPLTQAPVVIQAPLDDSFQRIMTTLGWCNLTFAPRPAPFDHP